MTTVAMTLTSGAGSLLVTMMTRVTMELRADRVSWESSSRHRLR